MRGKHFRRSLFSLGRRVSTSSRQLGARTVVPASQSKNGPGSVNALGRLRGNRRGSVLRLVSASLFPAALAIVSGPLLARAVGTRGQGEIAAVVVFGAALPILLSFGVADAISQRAALEPALRPQLLSAGIRYACYTVPVAIVANIAAIRWPLHSLGRGARIVAVLTMGMAPLGVLGYCLLGLLLAEGALGPIANVRVMTLIGNAVLTVGLFVAGRLTVTTYLAVNMAINVFVVVTFWVYVAIRPSGSCRLRPLMGFGFRAFAGTVANMANGRLDQMIMVPFVGSVQLGLYAVAVSISSLPQQFAQAVAARSFGEMASPEDRARNAERYLRLTVLLALGVGVVLALAVPFALPLLYGTQFHGSVAPFLILLPGSVALSVVATSTSVLSIYGQPGRASVAELAGLAGTVIGLVVLLGPAGIVGAALVSSISYTITLIIHILYLKRLRLRKLVPGPADVRWARRRLMTMLREAR
jgi:O-antigen/teichoic acid export membrane protein